MNLSSVRLKGLVSSLAVVLPGWFWAVSASAQSVPPCDPPAAGEYVLLVNSQTTDEQRRLEQVLPTGATVVPCRYLEQSVIRVGTFENEELARSWAEYLTTVEGFQTTVARPPTPSPTTSNSTANPTSASPSGSTQPDAPRPETAPGSAPYRPAVLGDGYAVLVRYFNRPSIAADVQAVLNASVGLAVYERQPYLLVAYSQDAAAAGQVLQGLSDRQFSTFMVNSSQVVVLTPSVLIPPPLR